MLNVKQEAVNTNFKFLVWLDEGIESSYTEYEEDAVTDRQTLSLFSNHSITYLFKLCRAVGKTSKHSSEMLSISTIHVFISSVILEQIKNNCGDYLEQFKNNRSQQIIIYWSRISEKQWICNSDIVTNCSNLRNWWVSEYSERVMVFSVDFHMFSKLSLFRETWFEHFSDVGILLK